MRVYVVFYTKGKHQHAKVFEDSMKADEFRQALRIVYDYDEIAVRECNIVRSTPVTEDLGTKEGDKDT